MSERNVDEQQVRSEHLDEVSVGMQWAYLIGVLLGGFLLMVALIAMLGGTAG
ncbi:MAG TPA: hypothetical protein VEW95_07725 [Candidatus Limnocylindrales bacterium]|nr:hypothetical protein [Candidatus Limnocylindrales bacterium]